MRHVIGKQTFTSCKVSTNLHTSYHRPCTPFRVFSTRSARKTSRIGSFLRSYLSTLHALPVLFVTLTVHYQNLSDRESNKILSLFLNTLRKKKIIRSYIWRAETQQRGAIHWHLLVVMHPSFYNACNNIHSIHSMLWSFWRSCHHAENDYAADFIDVKRLTSGGAAYYLSKYVEKLAPGRRALTTRTFGQSRDFSILTKPFYTYETIVEEINHPFLEVVRYPNCVVSLAFDSNVWKSYMFDFERRRYFYGNSCCFVSDLLDIPYLENRISLAQYIQNRRYYKRLLNVDNF